MITCPYCSHENRQGAFFCKNCGGRLACPRCRMLLDEEGDYCDNCGQALVEEPGLRPLPSETRKLSSLGFGGSSSHSGPLQETHQLLPLERFIPAELQNKLDAVRTSGAMEGERRVVTMMFCDVDGSTNAAEQFDPEEWAEIINGAFEYMIRPVYKYEGTVARLMGDSILAFFGAPIAHEDDPQRAVLAGLDIVAGLDPYQESLKQRYDLDFNVRIGINTGPVVVGAVGSDLRMEYSAMGDAINVAARMEQTAAPGTVRITQDTYRLVAPLFEFEDLGAISVKGKSEPVSAYRVLGRKAAPGQLRGIDGLEAPLIGRQAEWTQLKEKLVLLERGVGGIVFLTGEAGLGKSRLIRELWSDVKGAGGEQIGWHETACLSYEISQPYSFFQRLVRHSSGILATDDPPSMRLKLARFTENIPESGRKQALKVYESLLGLEDADGKPPLEGESFRGQLYQVTEAYWKSVTDLKPIVLVCDDLHWLDSASAMLLDFLFSLCESVPVLFLCALRPDREADGWALMERAIQRFSHRVQVIEVGPLSEEDSDLLVDNLLTISDLPATLRKNILGKAEGNPFFVEEVIRTLIESGAIRKDESGTHWVSTGNEVEIEIPDNLQSLLTTRVDKLDEASRQVLQLASLIGRNFYFRVLERVLTGLSGGSNGAGRERVDHLPEQLTELQHADLIREFARFPELEYFFRHALIQEAAYSTILHKLRRSYHLEVGQAIELLFPDKLDENAAALARHFEEAGEKLRAAFYHMKAGDFYFRLFALGESIEHYEQALALIDPSTTEIDQLVHLYTRRGRALEVNDDYAGAVENYREMARLAETRNDDRLRLGSLLARAVIHSVYSPVFDPELGLPLAEEAVELARKLGDYHAEARVLWILMLAHSLSLGDYNAGVAYGQEALNLARKHNLTDLLPFILNDFGRLLGFGSRLQEGSRLVEEALPLFEEAGNLPLLQDAWSSKTMLDWFAGDLPSALAASHEALKISRSIDNQWGIRVNSNYLGMLYGELGDFGKGLLMLEAVKENGNPSQQIAFANFQGLFYDELGLAGEILPYYEHLATNLSGSVSLTVKGFYAQQARLYVSLGELDSAQSTLDRLTLDPDKESLITFEVIGFIARAELAMAQGHPEQVLATLERIRTDQESYGIYYLMGDLYLTQSRAIFQADPSQAPKARQLLRAAAKMTRERGNKRVLWKILFSLSDLSDGDEAEGLRKEAREIVNEIAAGINDERIRMAFLNQRMVRQVLETADQV